MGAESAVGGRDRIGRISCLKAMGVGWQPSGRRGIRVEDNGQGEGGDNDAWKFVRNSALC